MESKMLSESLHEGAEAPAGAELMELLAAGINDFTKPDRWDNFHKWMKRMESVMQSVKQTKSTSNREGRELQNEIILLENNNSRYGEKLRGLLDSIDQLSEENNKLSDEIATTQEEIKEMREHSNKSQTYIRTNERKYFGMVQNIINKEINRIEFAKTFQQ